MNIRPILLSVLVSVAALAQTAPAPKAARVAVLHFQQAVLSTQEGQQIAAALKAKFDPKRTALEKRQSELTELQRKLQAGGPTLTAAVRAKMENDLKNGGRSLNSDVDELNSELQQEEGKAMQTMAGKMGDIIKNYAAQKGFAVVLDVSDQNTSVLWAAESANITQDIVKLYDQAHPAAGGAARPAAAPKPAPPAPATKKP